MINLTKQELINIDKPARYIGGEYNEIIKYDNYNINIALCYPNIYDVGMNNYLIQQGYDILNNDKSVWCQLAFAPSTDFEEVLRNKNIGLYSLEEKRNLSKFDIIVFNIDSVFEYTNILNMLELSDIPVFSKDRFDNYPIIIGVLAKDIINPYPIGDIFDVILLGNVEDIYGDIIFRYNVYKNQGRKRADFIESISNINGVFIPKINNSIKFSSIKNINKVNFAKSIKVSNLDINQELVQKIDNVDVIRQEKDAEMLVSNVSQLLANTGLRKIRLFGDNVNLYSNLDILVDKILDLQNGNVELYIDNLAFNKESLGIFRKISNSVINFDVITCDDKLRKEFGIDITYEEFLNNIRLAFENDFDNISLMFGIGLPNETYEALEQIIKMVNEVKSLFYDIDSTMREPNPSILINIKNFVPYPNTVFEDYSQTESSKLEIKQKFLKERLEGCEICFEDAYMSNIKNLLLRGNSEISKVIYNAYKNGARFDSLKNNCNNNYWKRAIRMCNVNLEEYISNKIDTYKWKDIQTYVNKT